MSGPEIRKRRYRLVDKPRFFSCLALAALVFAALLYAFAGLGELSVEAGERGGAQRGGAKAKSGDWRLTLVNASHPLPEGFRVETRELPNGLLFDARAYNDLMRMLQDGKKQGLSLVVCSAYRPNEKQKGLFDAQVAAEQARGCSLDEAVEAAKTKVAPPGTSEHELGLAVDIVALDYQNLDEGYLETPECRWLKENAHKYGFILRYPEGKSAITNIVFEPWHYRYVGAEAAEEITRNGLCLEEYLGMAD